MSYYEQKSKEIANKITNCWTNEHSKNNYLEVAEQLLKIYEPEKVFEILNSLYWSALSQYDD
jgi:hypothetical protein